MYPLFMVIGVLFISIATSLFRLDMQGGINDGRLEISRFVVWILIGFTGGGLTIFGFLNLTPRFNLRSRIKPLAILFVSYLIIQLVLGLFTGLIAVILHRFFNFQGDTIKNIVDFMVRLIQIPVKSGIVIVLFDIIFEQNKRITPLIYKIMGIFAGYTIFQRLLWLIGNHPALVILKIIVAAIATIILWYLLLERYKKENEKIEEDDRDYEAKN